MNCLSSRKSVQPRIWSDLFSGIFLFDVWLMEPAVSRQGAGIRPAYDSLTAFCWLVGRSDGNHLTKSGFIAINTLAQPNARLMLPCTRPYWWTFGGLSWQSATQPAISDSASMRPAPNQRLSQQSATQPAVSDLAGNQWLSQQSAT